VKAIETNGRARRKSGVQPPTKDTAGYLEPAVLTVEQTAAYLRISRFSAFKMARDGKLPVVHPVPRRTLIVKRRLDEMLMDGTLGATIKE
jgi:hypothetical protein